MATKYSNNAKTTLAAAIDSTVTTITVADASTFPTLGVDDEMYLTLAEPYGTATEIVKCTSVSGTVLTVVRGHEGTTPLSWVVDSNVQLRLTAGLLAAVTAETVQAAVELAIPAGGDNDSILMKNSTTNYDLKWSDTINSANIDGGYF